MNHDYEIGIAFSDTVNKACVERPLADKSRWRHIRLAIKHGYLGNHASQIKRYYGSLSESHAHSFRRRRAKSPEASPGGGLAWTSYPVENKKPRYLGNHASQIKSYHVTLSGSHCRSFRIRHEKSSEATIMRKKSRWHHIRSAIKPRYLGNHASLIKCYYGTLSGNHARSFRIRLKPEATLMRKKSRWRHFWHAIKPRYLGNHASLITCYYGTLSGSHARSFRNRLGNLPEAPLAEKSRWRHIRLQ